MSLSTQQLVSRRLLRLVMGDPELGARIREARQAMGLTQQDFAALVGWKDSQSVSNAERGITGVPHDRLREISLATGRPLSFFVDSAPAADPGELLVRLQAIEDAVALLPPLLESIDARLAHAAERSLVADVPVK
jgi:transcriptional regulator with XRE-family HTH domain